MFIIHYHNFLQANYSWSLYTLEVRILSQGKGTRSAGLFIHSADIMEQLRVWEVLGWLTGMGMDPTRESHGLSTNKWVVVRAERVNLKESLEDSMC